MVEVFKTDVQDPDRAELLIRLIHSNFPSYRANFDLTDCDNILRIKCAEKEVQADYVIDLLKDLDVVAEILLDITLGHTAQEVPKRRYFSCGFYHLNEKSAS